MIYRMELEGVRKEPTQYEGLFKYYAPEGYRFWVDNSCYGNVIYGMEELSNLYRLEKEK